MARTNTWTVSRVFGAGAVCAASLAASAESRIFAQEALAPAAAVESEMDGPLLAPPRLANRPEDLRDQSSPKAAAPAAPMSVDEAQEFKAILSAGETSRREGSAARQAPVSSRIALPLDPRSAAEAIAPEPESTSQPELAPELTLLRDRMKACSEYYSQRPENAGERSPWGVMHWLIAYGAETELLVGSRTVNAIGWLCWNGRCRGQQLFHLNKGRIDAHFGQPGLQGHAGQFLAMLAQWRVLPETSMRIEGRDFTVADLIEHEKRTCEPGSELTFKLIALSYYLESDETWTDHRGREWSISRLIQEELAQPIVGAACGGTHRMMGFSYAVRMRERDGKPIDGQWLRAKTFVDDYHEYTFRLQNADGSFSTNWFAGRGDFGDAAKRVETTGHIFEWMAWSLPKDQLLDPRMVRAASFLTETMIAQRNAKLEIGPKGHALHGLNIYLDRAFGAKPEYVTAEVARRRAEERR